MEHAALGVLRQTNRLSGTNKQRSTTVQRRLMALLFKKAVKVDSAETEATKNMASELGGGLTCLFTTQVISSRTNAPLFSYRTNGNAD
jgi:hypothetical protein